MEKSKYVLYCHTNKINNKKYIGITNQKPSRRWGKDGYGYHVQLKFYRAIQKYGWNNFKHEILFENLSSEEAEKLEIEMIAKYDTTNNNFGYNVSIGGGITLANRRQIKQFSVDGELLNVFESMLYIEKTYGYLTSSICQVCNGNKISAYGYIWRYIEDDFDLYSTELLNQEKPVNQYSINGKYLHTYDSISEARKETNIVKISDVCNKKRDSAGGYIWRFTNECDGTSDIEVDTRKIKKKRICQIDADNNIVGIYESLSEAEKTTSVSKRQISKCCNNLKDSHCGFRWEFYFGDEENFCSVNNIDLNQKQEKIPVYCIELNKTYQSMTTASEEMSICLSSISNCCSGKQKTAGGYHWEYAS